MPYGANLLKYCCMLNHTEVPGMNIETNISEETCTLQIEGDIDTTTSSQLENAVEECLPRCTKIVLDLAGVKYVSSAGIRSLLKTRRMVGNDNLVLKNLNNNIMEIIKITGFAGSLNIE